MCQRIFRVSSLIDIVIAMGIRILLDQIIKFLKYKPLFFDQLHNARNILKFQKRAAICLQYLRPFCRNTRLQDNRKFITKCIGISRQRNSRIPACEIDDRITRFDLPLLFRIQDHGKCCTILHGTGGIKIFQLCQHSGMQVMLLFIISKLYERCIADQLCN